MSGPKGRVGTSTNVSRCKFNFLSDAKIEDLKQIRMKKKSESKLN